MKFFNLFLALVLLSACGNLNKNSKQENPVQENKVQSLKIAVVDVKIVEAESLAMKDAFEKLKNKQKSIQQNISKQENDLQQEIQDLQSKQGVLAAKTMDEKRKSIEVKVQKLQQFIDEMNRNLEMTKIAISEEIGNNMQSVIKKIAQNRYDVVLPSNGLLYINNSNIEDITPGVISDLNKNISKINIDEFYKKATNDNSKK